MKLILFMDASNIEIAFLRPQVTRFRLYKGGPRGVAGRDLFIADGGNTAT